MKGVVNFVDMVDHHWLLLSFHSYYLLMTNNNLFNLYILLLSMSFSLVSWQPCLARKQKMLRRARVTTKLSL